MKKTVFRLLALSMSGLLVFSLCACKSDVKTSTDASSSNAQSTVEDKEANASVSDSTNPTSAVPSSTDSVTENGSVKPDDTSKPTQAQVQSDENKIPTNGSIQQVVNYYNKCANATKGYTGTVKIFKSEGQSSKFAKFPVESLKGQGDKVLAKATGGTVEKTESFSNGKSSTGETLVKFLPPSGNAKMSTLEAAGVKNANCIPHGNGCKIVINLVQESVGYNGKPKWHSATMDILSITDETVKPFKMQRDNCKFDYKGATITAIINEKGYLESLNIYEPVYITATLKLGFSVDVEVDGLWKQDIAFTY